MAFRRNPFAVQLQSDTPYRMFWEGEQIAFGDRVMIRLRELTPFYVIGFGRNVLRYGPLASNDKGCTAFVTPTNCAEVERGHIIRAIELRQRYLDNNPAIALEDE